MDVQRTNVKQRKRRRLAIRLGTAVMLLAAALLALSNLQPAVPAVSRSAVWIQAVERGQMLRQVRGTGVLVPKEERWIASQSAGRVERILLKPGARVNADAVLMELSNPDLLQQLEEAEWELSAAQADQASLSLDLESQYLDRQAGLVSAQSQYESARLQADAEAELAIKGIIPEITARQSELDASQLNVRKDIEGQRLEKFQLVMKARLRAQDARIRQLENIVQRRTEQVENLVVRAGIGGVLQQIPVEEGQQIIVGASVGKVARPEELLAELQVPEINARHVQLDQNVAVDTRNGIVQGKVIRIDPAVQSGTVQVDVEFVEGLPPGARPDLTVDGVIEIERLTNVLHVGRPAYAQADSSMQLFRLNEGTGEAERINVQIGRTSVNRVEITDGVNAGDLLILSDISAWDRASKLSIQ